jgi:hypothetical protein
MMLLLTVRADSANGKKPCLPASAKVLAVNLIAGGILFAAGWARLKAVWR